MDVSIELIKGTIQVQKKNDKMISVTSAMVLIVTILFYCQTASASILTIYHIDVDQGDATLFVSPSGNSLLVDSGKNRHGVRIKDVMDQAGINRIDHFEVRNGMPMNLNNNGDTVHLYDGNHLLVDRFEYTVAQRGVTISTGH